MKKGLIVLCVVTISLITVGSVFRIKHRQWNTELEPLTGFFPVFSEAEDCCWKEGNYNTMFSVPGPSSAWIKGYLKFPDTTFNQLYQNYSWTQVESQPYQIESCSDYPVDDTQWLLSQKLSTEIMMPKFVGWVYLNEQHNIVYFYAEFA